MALAARRGITRDPAAHGELVGWLDWQPGARFFEMAYQAVRAALTRLDPESRAAAEHDLVEWATRIAEATGGILGMVPISRD